MATIECSVSNGSDSPSSLTALTRKLYSWPSWRPLTSISGSAERPTGTQRPVAWSSFSTTYAVIGLPPSSSGLAHLSLAELAVMSETLSGPCGFVGAPGHAVEKLFNDLCFESAYQLTTTRTFMKKKAWGFGSFFTNVRWPQLTQCKKRHYSVIEMAILDCIFWDNFFCDEKLRLIFLVYSKNFF